MTFEDKISPNDLVLKFEGKTDISKYYDFIDVLCAGREYQKEAIITTVKFFLDQKIKSTKELMEKNYSERDELKKFFDSLDKYLLDVQLKDKKSVTIDLATGTGKTWVMYGVAQILLAEGVIDQALVLCPSVTIKKQLMDRFKSFTEDENLKMSLPIGSKIKNPDVHDAQTTMKKGDLCVHNIHGIYEKTGSSIRDSLAREGKGQRTLIINDEAHHYLNSNDADMKLWGQFLEKPEYNFKYILNLTGTPYKGNVYFKNVISRFSIKEAIDKKFIKDILYKTETSKKLSEFEKFDLIYKHHIGNKKKYSKLNKVISLFVTSSVSEADNLEDKFKKFVIKQNYISQEDADKKIITVTSAQKHKKNVDILESVDADENPVEWIISVSMLTEGWDVKKVFQIIPHEKRAFDSKLLISQVLGRGLRVPLEYYGDEELPQVIIANHDSWSKEIEEYVYAVSEINRITSKILEKKNKSNFEIDYLDYTKKEVTEKKLAKQEKMISIPSVPNLTPETVVSERLRSLKTGDSRTISIQLESESRDSSERIAQKVYNEFFLSDHLQGTSYLKLINKKKINDQIIKKCAEAHIDPKKVDYQNKQRILSAFEVIKRKNVGTTNIKLVYDAPKKLNTLNLVESKISIPQIKEAAVIRGVFFDENYKLSDKETIECIEQLIEEKLRLRAGAINKLAKDQELKTPLNVIICDSENEIRFVERLIEKNDNLISWVKNNAYSNFYAIPYNFRDGTHSKTLNFNPDFIIKTNKIISIAEVKSAGDLSPMNIAKKRGAIKYIAELTKKSKQKVCLNFVSKKDYDDYFTNVIKNGKTDWKSVIDKQLEKEIIKTKDII